MGVLCDLVLAGERDAEKILAAGTPIEKFPGVDIKGIDTVKLDALRKLLGKKAGSDDIDAPVAMSDEGEQMVFRVPKAFVTALAGLPAADRAKIGKKWAAIEEFRRDGWKAPEVASALSGICQLAAKAVETKQTVFLRLCL